MYTTLLQVMGKLSWYSENRRNRKKGVFSWFVLPFERGSAQLKCQIPAPRQIVSRGMGCILGLLIRPPSGLFGSYRIRFWSEKASSLRVTPCHSASCFVMTWNHSVDIFLDFSHRFLCAGVEIQYRGTPVERNSPHRLFMLYTPIDAPRLIDKLITLLAG